MINLFVNSTLVDLSEDFDLLITRSIADIKNPEQRSSDWSKTAKIPGTKANNILFGNIFEVVLFTIDCQCQRHYAVIVQSLWCCVSYTRSGVFVLKVF